MVVLLGLCMLPSIASVVSSNSSSALASSFESIGSFFFLSGGSQGHLKKGTTTRSRWSSYTRVLAKIWITGLSMAWINTALGFIIPSAENQASALSTWISLVSTLCLAILMQALHPLFPGNSMLLLSIPSFNF